MIEISSGNVKNTPIGGIFDLITRQHAQETLSKAYIHALAAKAGVNLALEPCHDYGVDGAFRPIVSRDGRLVDSGFNLEFQLKSTTRWSVENDHIVYDLEAKTYNDLATREPEADGCVLILLCLPTNEEQWLETTHDALTLRNCCYWFRIEGMPTDNKEQIRVRIPRQNLLTAESVQQILKDEQARRRGMFA